MASADVAAKLLNGGQWLGRRVLARRFVRNVGSLATANVISAGLSLVQGILIARWLGPELYGVAALIMMYPGLVYTFFDARSSEASVKYLSEFHGRGESERVIAMCKLGYIIDLGVALLAFLVVLITASWAADSIVHRPEVLWLLVAYAAAFIPRALVGTSQSVFLTLGRFSIVGAIEVVTSLLRAGLVLGLVMAGWRVEGVIWGHVVTTVLAGILCAAIAYEMIRRTWGASWLRGSWRSLGGHRRGILSFVAFNDLNALVGMIPKQLDSVLLGYFRSPTEVGYYKLAKSLAGAVSYLVSPLQSVTYPELARLWGVGDRGGLRRKVKRLAVYVGVPAGLLVLLSTVPVPLILPVLVGHAYDSAITATQVLVVGSAVWLTFFWLRPVFMAQGKIKHLLVISLGVVILSLVAYPFIIPSWGYLGLAVWWVIAQLLSHVVAVFWLYRMERRA